MVKLVLTKFKDVWTISEQLSRSAHRTPNFTELYWHFWVYFDINLKLLSRKNNKIFGIRKIGCSMN